MNGEPHVPTDRIAAALIALCALLCSTCSCASAPASSATVAPSPWTARSQWEVTRTDDGTYRAYHVQHALADRLIVTVSTTTSELDWVDWLNAGSPGASSRVTSVVALPGWTVSNRYDHIAGKPMEPAPAGTKFQKEGRPVAAGTGVYAPGIGLISELVEEPRIWTGFYSDPKDVKTDLCPAKSGLAPYAVGAGSLVDHAGMKVNDVIVKLWPWGYNDEVFKSYLNVGKAVADRFMVGDPARVEFLRAKPEGGYEMFRKELTWPGVPCMNKRPGAKLLEFERQWLPREQAPEKALLDLMAQQTGRAADNADLMRRLGEAEDESDVYRMAPVLATHRHPFLMGPVARHYLDAIPTPAPDRIAKQIAWLRGAFLTDGGAPDAAAEAKVRDWRGKDLNGHLDFIEDVLALAAACNEEALKGLSAQERKYIQDTAPGLLEGFVAAHMMCFDPDIARQQANVELLQVAHKLDMAALIRQAETLSRLVDGEFLASLKAVMQASPAAGGRIATRNTKWGAIVLNGAADDRYVGGSDAAFIADLGGDDFYANNTGSSVPGAIPSAVLVDFAGNDHYESWQLMCEGCGFLGVGILLDCAGDDSYVGIRYAQGAGFMGIGVLADAEGNDTYRAIDYGQGVGQFGAGLLLDDRGRNRYEGHQACQGVGFTWGVGLLYSADANGDDTYYCKGQIASGYEDPGSYEGWGQGLGCGHRPYASGGVGLLVDQGGSDLYEGGTFSQGGGYFYGLGILNDRAGDDHYRGSRYNMGFTAHQAVGVFLDDAGNDHYYTCHFVAMGMAWDESNTLFVDRAGDDVYFAPGFAFGTSAMNGFTLFEDGGGSDKYVGARPAGVSGNSYHNGTSIGYFLDLGAGKDEFNQRQEGEISAGPEAPNPDAAHWFFVDSPSADEAVARIQKEPLKPQKD